MQSLEALFGKVSLKPRIIDALASGKVLTARKVHSIVAKGANDVTYQGVHKAMAQMEDSGVLSHSKAGFCLSKKWSQSWSDDAQRLSMGNARSKVSEITVHFSTNELYATACRLVKEYDELRIATKTPALILSSERDSSPLRKKYSSLLNSRVMDGSLCGKKMFSTDLTSQLIVESGDFAAVERLKSLLAVQNFEFRHVPSRAILSCAIASHEALLLFPAPHHTDITGYIHVRTSNTKPLADVYDRAFSDADSLYSFITGVEATMQKG